MKLTLTKKEALMIRTFVLNTNSTLLRKIYNSLFTERRPASVQCIEEGDDVIVDVADKSVENLFTVCDTYAGDIGESLNAISSASGIMSLTRIGQIVNVAQKLRKNFSAILSSQQLD